MTAWLRLAALLATTKHRPKLGWTDESALNMRVWPNDLDLNLHMNNARYLTAMDLGRIDLLMRVGLGKYFITGKLKPVLAASLVRYRRSLKPFQNYRLRSQLIGGDDKWLFIQHIVESDGEIFCQAVVKGLFLGPEGKLPTQQLMALAGAEGPPPCMPDWARDWQAAESAFQD